MRRLGGGWGVAVVTATGLRDGGGQTVAASRVLVSVVAPTVRLGGRRGAGRAGSRAMALERLPVAGCRRW